MDHEGFRRTITYDCMFCHNAYPRIPAANEQSFAEPIYLGDLPEGIDCARCHGSGAEHIRRCSDSGLEIAIHHQPEPIDQQAAPGDRRGNRDQRRDEQYAGSDTTE